MLDATQHNAAVYTDLNALADLRRQARDDSPEALETVARQFESIFMQMMLKSMRDASLAEGIFDSDQSQMYTDMYDKQLTTSLGSNGNGIGLAEIMVRQLQGSVRAPKQSETDGDFSVPERRHFAVDSGDRVVKQSAAAAAVPVTTERSVELTGDPKQFVEALLPYSKQAAERLGVRPEMLLAQAALETGWGRSVIRHGDGRSSHNLFNIKADNRWSGESVAKQTLEYRDGVAARERARFRAYGSFGDSFNDYADFITGSGRYQQALKHADDPKRYFELLQGAGYATDPEYSNKINRIMGGEVIGDASVMLKKTDAGTLS